MDNKNNIRIAFGIVLLSLLLGLTAGAALIGILGSDSDVGDPALSLTIMGISTLIIGIPVIVYLKYRNIPMAVALRLNRISPKSMLSIILLSIGIIVLIDELDRIIYILFVSK